MAASATFALKAGVWLRRGRLLIVSPDLRGNLARRQAETPLSELFRFSGPPQSVLPELIEIIQIGFALGAEEEAHRYAEVVFERCAAPLRLCFPLVGLF